ncbi:TIGR01457 family HAD-type hydrolase [Paenibacillus sp. strain BS8-2]
MEQNTLHQVKGLLIDLDGTMYHGSRPIEGASRLIHYLQQSGLAYRFVTNNSSATPEEVASRLIGMDIPACPDDVCTSAQAAAVLIAGLKPNASVYMIGQNGLLEALTDAGLRITDDEPDFVVQGIDRELSYGKVARAVHHIRNGVPSILTNPDLLVPSTDGMLPGAGSIGAMIRAASGVEPIVIGKPSSILMDYALSRMGLPADGTLVVGDNLATDIAAGVASGCGTALVLTGLTTKENYDYYANSAGCSPDKIYDTLDELRSDLSSR